MKGFRGHLGVTVTGGLKEVVTPWAGASTLVEAYLEYGRRQAPGVVKR